MLEFELRDAWRGWRHATRPDNLKVDVRVDETTRLIDASVELLLEFYGHVVHEAECHLVGGSGTTVELDDRPTGVRFCLNYSVAGDTTFAELDRELAPLLRETFWMHDRLGRERREAELAAIQQRVDDRGVGYDVRALYEDLGADASAD
ncbi:MAG: hypothetical protein ABEJ23_05805 [Haloarculaceae archaeon]